MGRIPEATLFIFAIVVAMPKSRQVGIADDHYQVQSMNENDPLLAGIGEILVSSHGEPLHSPPISIPMYGRMGELQDPSSEVVAMPSPSDLYALWRGEASFRQRSARIAIKVKKKILFIYAEEIVAIEARGNYSVAVCASNSHRLRESISTLERTLHAHGFLRIHRSVLVNAASVEEIQPWPTGEYALRVKNGKEYTVTRAYKKHLHALAQLWIGMNGFAAAE